MCYGISFSFIAEKHSSILTFFVHNLQNHQSYLISSQIILHGLIYYYKALAELIKDSLEAIIHNFDFCN